MKLFQWTWILILFTRIIYTKTSFGWVHSLPQSHNTMNELKWKKGAENACIMTKWTSPMTSKRLTAHAALLCDGSRKQTHSIILQIWFKYPVKVTGTVSERVMIISRENWRFSARGFEMRNEEDHREPMTCTTCLELSGRIKNTCKINIL